MPESRNQQRAAREARERLRLYNARQEVHAHQLARRRRDNILAVVGVVVIAALAAVTQVVYFTSGPGAPAPTSSSSPTPTPSASAAAGQNVGAVPDPSVAEARDWTGSITLNDVKLGITLDGAAAPQAVASVVTDIQNGYYTGKSCHREVADANGAVELIQCGSVDGTGAGDTTYQFGPVENAPADGVYKKAVIAMARGTGEYSMDHQFFIMLEDAPLGSGAADDPGYTVIGTVTSGLDALAASPIVTAGIGPDGTAPATPTTITAATIQ